MDRSAVIRVARHGLPVDHSEQPFVLENISPEDFEL